MPQVFGWSDDDFEDRAQDLAGLIRRVWRAIARLIAAQAEGKTTVTLEVARPITTQWQQALDDQIVGFVRNVYLDAAGGVSDSLDAPDELLVGDDLVEVYTNAARNRLVGIGDDVWKNVQAQITLGNQLGEGIPEIAARIRNVTGVSDARSLTIARTEVHAAFESGAHEQAMFVDPHGEKIWLATDDARTRPSHRAADGQRIKIGESFSVGGSKLRYPGDPLGAAEDCINCRCSVAYDFDMITTVVDEPEPAMVASGGQVWKPAMHPRGNDGKFIKSGIVADFLKKSNPNIIDVTKAVGNLDSHQWGKLTDTQKTHIKSSVDKLPKGTATHDLAKKTLDSLEKTAAATAPEAPPKPKTKIGETYAKLKDANHGDVLATGTKYNSAGVAQKFRITADKTHVHPDYMPYGKMKLEFLKKNGEPGTSHSGDILAISQKLHPLPAKGKKPGKVEWDEPGTPQVDAPDADVAVPEAPSIDAPSVDAPSAPTKIPAGLKGKPGDPAKITTGVVWGKHDPDTTVVEDEWGLLRVQWDGKKYNLQSKQDDGSWNTDAAMTKKQFYDQHKGDGTGWVIPGAPKTNDDESGQLLNDVAGPETTPEPPQTPVTPPVSATSAPDWTKAQDFSGFTKVGGQAGSNPGGKYKAPDGTEWYIKKPKSANHAANEMAAAAFYNLAGIDAPQVMKGKGAPELGNPQTGTKIVPGANANLGYKLDDPAYLKQIQSGFAMDAWLANWDVAGMGYDNVVEGADGKPHRIDVGGALLYRAQGEPKGNAFGPIANELYSLRDGTNPQATKVFGSMTDEDIRKSATKLEAISDAQIEQIIKDAGLDASVAETLKARRQHILEKFPPISEADEPPTTSPDVANAKAKLQKLYDKGLITWADYVDTTGETPVDTNEDPSGNEPDTSGPATTADGALYFLGKGEQSKMVSSDGKYALEKLDENSLSKYSLESKNADGTLTVAFIDNASDVDYVTGQLASLWYPAKKSTASDVSPTAPGPTAPSGPMIDGSSLGLKDLHNLVVNGKVTKKYSDGQVIATSPSGDQQFVWYDDIDGYALRDTVTGDASFLSNIHIIKKIRDEAFHVPESLLPQHGGTLVDKPTLRDDNETIGTTNSGALFALENGDAEKMVTIDGKYELYKSPDGKWTAFKENHPNDTSSVTLIDGPDELEQEAGLKVWYPQQEIDQSKNESGATAGVSNKPVDLSVIQEDIGLSKYTSGETIGITQDGQQKLVYSAFLGGVQLKHKVGNTGDEDMDWDTEASYSDDTGSPVADFLDDYPNIKLFEPQSVEPDSTGSANWDNILSGSYLHNDVVAQTEDGKFQLVHKGMGNYSLYKKDDTTGAYNSVSGAYYTDDIINGDIDAAVLGVSENARWKKVNPGTQFKSGKTPPAKKMPAKKVAKAAKAVPHAYSAAAVSPGEKSFYLDDAEDGSLVPAEAIHLLNGVGGLTSDDVKKLTPKQVANIDKQIGKALDEGMAGAGSASLEWSDLKHDIVNPAKVADDSYFQDMEEEMYAGTYHTGDIMAVSPDGKQRIVFHSTEAPDGNPDSFALEKNGLYGWETSKIFGGQYMTGSPAELMALDADITGNVWHIPRGVTPDFSNEVSFPPVPAGMPENALSGLSFDPPGTGNNSPGTLFDMLSWIPEDKPLLVGKTGNGHKYVITAGPNDNGKKALHVSLWNDDSKNFEPAATFDNEATFNWWTGLAAGGFKWDAPGTLPDKSALEQHFPGHNNFSDDSGTPTVPSVPQMPALTGDDIDAVWDHIQTMNIGDILAVNTQNNMRLKIAPGGAGADAWKYTVLEYRDADTGQWKFYGTAVTKQKLQTALSSDTNTWTYPDAATTTAPAPSAPTVLTPSAPSVPSAPTPAGPPTPKTVPGHKVADIKFHLKQSGNLGYYSKPENIWAAVKEWQSKPGNEQYSPMDIFQSLDKTLKTSKPNPFQEKMTKWAASKKGAQTVGADGLFGPVQTSPTATSPLAGVDFSVNTLNGDKNNAAKIWSALDSLPDGTVIAHVTTPAGVDKQMHVATAPSGAKIIHIKAFDPVTAQWEGYGSYMNADKLAVGLSQKWAPGPKVFAAPKASIPDIEAGNDISGFDDAKKQSVYQKFKSQQFTYLSSPAHAIFDAVQDVSKTEGLTLAQIINIVDEQGALKVSKPNAGLFKQKLSEWLKTPEAAAHILNEPTQVKGLPTPPDFLPQYHPDKTLPTFEASNVYKYNYVETLTEAQKLWDESVAQSEPITSGQQSGLHTWTGGAYTSINSYLFEPGGSLSSTHKGAMNGSQKGMRPSTKPMVLVRGTGFTGLGNAKNHAQLEKLIGTTWRNNAFAATSVGKASHDAPGVHSPAFSSFPLWIEFECPPGTPMAWLDPFSSHKGEREMLLASNLHYKILSVEKKMIPGYGMKSVARVRIVPKPDGAAE